MRRHLAELEMQVKLHGLMAFIHSRIHTLVGERPIKGFEEMKIFFAEKEGLEIGGPSRIFSSNQIVPVYPIAKRVDNCNFSTSTIWEGTISEGETFKASSKWTGSQFIGEGTELKMIRDEQYDFVLSSHTLEHIANPIKALLEWKRVLRKDGFLLLCLPNRLRTFDRERQSASLEHLVQDYDSNVGEDDLTHIGENLDIRNRLLRFGIVRSIASKDDDASIRDNLRTRRMHHHVFDVESTVRLMDFVELNVLLAITHPPHHIIVLGQKSERNKASL